MKNLKLVAVAFFGITSLISCDNDNEVIVNEEEVITTVTTTLTNGTSVITLLSRDLDGDGPNAPVVTVSGKLMANKVYTGRVTILNETETPAGDITAEVKGEGDEHQLFFQVPSAFGTFMYTDVDKNGKPIGLEFTLTTKTASTGSLVVTLRHLPNKSASGVANGDITNAGGATDFAVTYPLVVE
nr:type 1 periplasmic binding fold superfamily protein [uncultured Flavobacterium sp.]